MTRYVGITPNGKRHIGKGEFGTWCGLRATLADPRTETCQKCWHNRSENSKREANRRARWA